MRLANSNRAVSMVSKCGVKLPPYPYARNGLVRTHASIVHAISIDLRSLCQWRQFPVPLAQQASIIMSHLMTLFASVILCMCLRMYMPQIVPQNT